MRLEMKKNIYSLLVVLSFSLSLLAQVDVEFSTRTPKSTVVSFKAYMKSNNFNPSKASFALNSSLSQSKKTSLAVELNSVLVNYGRIKVDKLPDQRRYKDDNGDYKFILYKNHPEIYLERVRGKWLFSEETLSFVAKYEKEKIKSKFKRGSSDVWTTAKGDSIDVSFSMASPYNTIISHLVYVQDSTFNPDYLSKLIVDSDKLSKDNRIDKVVKIYQFYLGAAEQWVTINEIPKDKNYVDSVSGKHIFVINKNIPEIYLEKYGNDWKYSEDTADLIDELHEEIYPIGAESVFTFGKYFKDLIGVKYANIMFFGMQLYQFAMVSFFLIVFVFSFLIVKLIVKKIIFRFLDEGKGASIIYQSIISLFLIIFNFWFLVFIPALEFSNDVMVILKRIFGSILIFAITNFVLNIIEIWFEVMTRNEPKETMTARKGAFTFAMAIMKIVAVVIGSIFIVDKLGFDLAGLLTGLSIGGFAFALGAQETIKNFFGSIMIFIDKPFKVGDWVEINGDEGMVEEVGLRTSRIRTFYNSIVIIPNSEVSNTTIDNYAERRYRRYKTYFKLPLNTDIDKVEAFVSALDELINSHDSTRKDYYHVRVNNIGLYSIDILFYTFFVVPDWSAELKARQEIILSVLRIAKEVGVEFAVPPVVGVEK